MYSVRSAFSTIEYRNTGLYVCQKRVEPPFQKATLLLRVNNITSSLYFQPISFIFFLKKSMDVFAYQSGSDFLE